MIKNEIAAVELERTKPKPKPKYNITALKERLRRLNVTYMAGNISDDEYLTEDAEIKALIAKAEDEAPPKERDIEPIRKLLNTDIKNIYSKLSDDAIKKYKENFLNVLDTLESYNMNTIFFQVRPCNDAFYQ